MGYPKYEEKEPEKNSHTHSLFVVITGTPESLFELQRTLFEFGPPNCEIKKFEIKPVQN
jgi:hypothetical protein